MLPTLDAYAVPPSEHAAARAAVTRIVDETFRKTAPECQAVETEAARQIWKGMWCDAVVQLVLRHKLDEEIDDVLRLCIDPSFDPRAERDESDEPDEPDEPDATEHPLPPPPRPPEPPPLDPPLPVEPMDGSTVEGPPNLWTATTREELADLGLMRLMEGTTAGAPIKGPSAHLVLFAYNPAWPGLEQAQADIARLAVEHPRLTFVETSFVDTQRHFGKPEDLYGLIWVLTAAGPDGRVFPEPIARDDPRDAPPTAEQWAKMIAHASGFVGARTVWRIARPQRFGDVLVAMAAARRPVSTRPRRPVTARPRKRRGRPRRRTSR
ncbi:MAG: hypothetical protein AB1Z98_20940 [Nannocystaceae bacterium]